MPSKVTHGQKFSKTELNFFNLDLDFQDAPYSARQLCDSCPKINLIGLSQKVKISIIPSLFCHLLVGMSPNCFVSFRRLSECRL